MKSKTVTFNIFRFRPNSLEGPHFQKFEVAVTDRMTIIDSLKHIQTHLDPSLMFRHSCHHASCGTCACRINGIEMLACTTRIVDLDSNFITIEPLANLEPIGDLAVDMQPFFKPLSKDWSHLRPSERIISTSDQHTESRYVRFDNCIECGACYSACPVMQRNKSFLGPAVLASVHNEFKKTGNEDLLKPAVGDHGERLCERAINCSRVCPSNVQPARHILQLRKLNKR